MRRLLSLLLLAVFGLPIVAPVISGATPEEMRLPACCRRSGAHHCAMKMSSAAASEKTSAHGSYGLRWSTVSATCPYAPATAASLAAAGLHTSDREVALLVPASHPSGVPQTESRRRIALDRARGKRGPPRLLVA